MRANRSNLRRLGRVVGIAVQAPFTMSRDALIPYAGGACNFHDENATALPADDPRDVGR
jgi:hypothetical protein